MKFYFKDAFDLMLKTYSFVIARFVVYSIFALFMILYFLFFLWLLSKLSFLGGFVAFLIMLVAVGGFIGIYILFRDYVLYLIKAAQIAVIAELIAGKNPPKGIMEQFKYGTEKVKKRFGSVTALFVIDQLISGVLVAFNQASMRLISIIPVQSVQQILEFIVKIINIVVSYIDEAILAYLFMRDDLDPWSGARDGVILYAQNWKSILVTAAVLVFLSYIFFFVGFSVFNAMTAIIVSSWAPEYQLLSLIIAFLMVFVLYSAIISPFILCSIIVTYINEVKDQKPNPTVQGMLIGISDKFKEIVEKAKSKLIPPSEQKQKEGGVSSKPSLPSLPEKVDKALVSWLVESRRKGYTYDELKDILKSQGYSNETIDLAIEEAKKEEAKYTK